MTAKSKSERLRRLLSHGYFAPELPPCFVSEDFAKYRKYIYQNIINLPMQGGKPAHHRFVSEPTWFYFPRFGKDDRRHGVPNVIAHLLISNVISENYVDLRKKARLSGISASPPIFDWNGPRAMIRSSIDLRDDFRADLSSRREEFISADIRAFFHSIYTHAIPWAIYGKGWAKLNRGMSHYGNLLDLFCRNAQDGQTVGLPVGPDTSRIIAEVIASAIDTEIAKKIGVRSRDASRYIDDYTVSSNNLSGEVLIAALRQAVSQFELELNNEKSSIHSTASRQNAGWKQAVRAHIPRTPTNAQNIQQFFYEVARICGAHPEINVEKFSLQNARLAIVRSSDWKKIQNLLISAYRRNSTLINLMCEIFILRNVEFGDLNKENLKEFLEARIPVLAQSNRTGEVIWLLFLAIRVNITLSSSCLELLFSAENSLIALLVAKMKYLSLIQGNVDFRLWNQSLNPSGLKSVMWLYAYEGATTGLSLTGNAAFVENDQYFSLLNRKKVRFFSADRGFLSMAAVLRVLRNDNNRVQRMREDFEEDFDFELDEFDDDDGDDDNDIHFGDDY